MFSKVRLVVTTAIVVWALSYTGNAETIDTAALLMAVAALIKE